MEADTTDKPSAARCSNGSGRSRIGIYLANGLIVFFLVCFGLGLASQSPAAYREAPPASFVLGKSPRLWGTTLLSATLCLLVIFGRVRRVEFLRSVGKLSGRVLLTLAITVTLYEAAGFTFARHLPITLLQNVPDWVHDVLPESAFERPPAVRIVLDYNGFPNADESLYLHADVLTFGDCFTTAGAVDFQDSWPQQLGRVSGMRVLNLARGSTVPYHFWRLAKSSGVSSSPSAIVLGLQQTSVSTMMYSYLDYVKMHPEIKSMEEYMRVTQGGTDMLGQKQSSQVWQYPDPRYPNWLSVVSRNILVPISWVLPFTSATFEYTLDKTSVKPAYPFSFKLGGKIISMDYYIPDSVTVLDLDPPVIHHSPQAYGAMIHHNEAPPSRLQQDFRAMVRLAAENGIKLYPVYIPSAWEVYAPLLQEATDLSARAQSAAAENTATENRPSVEYAELLALAKWSGVPLYDATPYLQAKARVGEQLNGETFHHPSPKGHLRIAEFVQSIMTDKGANEALRNNRSP